VNLEPVPDVAALQVKGKKEWICVADLHLGIEVQLRRSGFNIPTQSPKMLSSLESLSSIADRLIILGDLKHRIPAVSYREDKEIPPFMRRLGEMYEEVVVVAGNHDGGISAVLPGEVKKISGAGTLIEDTGFVHGHVWPSKASMSGRRLVMGHIHPSVLLIDSIGSKSNEKCWLRSGFDRTRTLERYGHCPEEVVVVPAFNPLLTGTPINGRKGAYLGPLFRNGLIDERVLSAYLLDGTNLGVPPKA
jgi:hypothetical protein